MISDIKQYKGKVNLGIDLDVVRGRKVSAIGSGSGKAWPATLKKGTKRLHMGTALAELGRRAGLTDDDIATFEHIRDRNPVEPVGIE